MGLRVGSLTFGGIASGLPTDQIIQQLLELERRPINLLSQQRDRFNAQLEIFQDLSSKTTTLRNALRNLDNLGLLGNTQSAEEEFSKFTATSSDSSVLTATATGRAQAGTIDIEVTALASAERLISATGYADEDTAVTTGTLTINVGTDTPVVVTIDSSNNSLSGLVQAINDSGADVTASILDTGAATDPLRIVIQGNTTGVDRDISITEALTSNPGFATSQAAADAAVTIDPDGSAISVSSSSNTFSNILTGLSLEVESVSAVKQTITVEPDLDAIVEAISGIVSAFNAVTSVIQEQFEVDPATNRGGILIANSTLSSLSQRLGSVIASQIGSGTITSAGQIGLSIDTDSQLSLDEDELRDQLAANFSSVRSFFTGSGGFADGLRTVADSFVDSVDGALTARINGTSASIQDITDQITAAEDRLGTVEENLVRQFSALERIVSEIQIQGNFLAQFLLQSQR